MNAPIPLSLSPRTFLTVQLDIFLFVERTICLLSLPLVTVLCILQISSGNPSSQLARVSEVAQLCPTLCDTLDCSPPGSSVHGMLQARILEWVAISFSRDSSQPRDRTQVSRIAGRLFII